ncbi:DUF4224 domain-containing protein [Thiomonas sp.]
MTAFLTEEELVFLTARKRKTAQLESLRRMGVPFFVNGAGRPVVARSAVDGRSIVMAEPLARTWVPRVLQSP